MWVYDDVVRTDCPDRLEAEIAEAVAALQSEPPGLGRHAALVSAFILAAERAQGVADAAFEAAGCDRPDPSQHAALALLQTLAAAVVASWRSRFGAPPPRVRDLPALAGEGRPCDPIRVRRAEGFALYGVYPEAYVAAALASGLGPDTAVVGIRSIGTGLAAIVSAALGAGLPQTVRPTGDPYRRTITAAPEFADAVRARNKGVFAVVDEGPGLSGSSFAAAADFLDRCGVAPDRVHLFPSHAGEPGPAAGRAIRLRYGLSPRHPAPMDYVLLAGEEPLHRLGRWVADLVGPLDAPLEDVSGGGWRRLASGGDGGWPPVHPWLERRKFLARVRGERFLVKFAGLGAEGPRKLADAKRLHAGGFTPEPVGLCHGFLVERWIGGRTLDWPALDRRCIVQRVAAYIGFRARHLAPPRSGASLATLAKMARHNAGLALDSSVAAALDPLFGEAERLEARIRRISTDNRMHRFEWLVTPDGRILKTDALDHNTGHDLVGCQDAAADAAGAAVEFDLDATEIDALAKAVGDAAGRPVDRDLLAFYVPCHLAFQLGLWTLASQADADGGRASAMADRYAAHLRAWSARVRPGSGGSPRDGCATRPAGPTRSSSSP